MLARSGIPAAPFDGCHERYAAGLRGDWRTAADLATDPYEQALELGFSGSPAEMRQGWEALERMGAHAPATMVRRALIDRGVTRLPPRRSAADPATQLGLTDRQLDVLELVAAGATNREIGQQLRLSVRTVDKHVAAILARLGVRSRREAAESLRDR